MSNLSDDDLNDMQRLILQGLGKYRAARYCLFHIPKGKLADAQHDLKMLLKYVARASQDDKDNDKSRPFRICIAFTWKGLQRFGLDEESLHNVPLAFKEGMASETRSARLKDEPEDWQWSDVRGAAIADGDDLPGEASFKDIHLLIAGFTKVDEEDFNADVVQKIEDDWDEITHAGAFGGLECIRKLPDALLKKDLKGHFGYRDGISQPYIEGSGTSRKPLDKFAHAHIIKPGEFILGHRNEFAQYIPPLWIANDPGSAADQLSKDGLAHKRRDFGRNGTYLVFRQIRQFKGAFEDFLDESVINTVPGEVTTREMVAAKLVGRWPGGAPLTLAPEQDDPSLKTANDFLYDREDGYGYKCPIGSHIRRSNPRDSIVEQGSPIEPDAALTSHRRRRIIRRGRPYHNLQDKKDIGFHFICLNADIREQFEFIQETWINSQRFGCTWGEVDPIVGAMSPDKNRVFTIQRSPISQSLDLQAFVEVVGGGYFFLPSIRALLYLGELKHAE